MPLRLHNEKAYRNVKILHGAILISLVFNYCIKV